MPRSLLFLSGFEYARRILLTQDVSGVSQPAPRDFVIEEIETQDRKLRDDAVKLVDRIKTARAGILEIEEALPGLGNDHLAVRVLNELSVARRSLSDTLERHGAGKIP